MVLPAGLIFYLKRIFCQTNLPPKNSFYFTENVDDIVEVFTDIFRFVDQNVENWVIIDVNAIQEVLQGCSLHKTCHKYPTMLKLGTVIPYLKKKEN